MKKHLAIVFVCIFGLVFGTLNVLAGAVEAKIKTSVTVGWQSEPGKFYRILGTTNIGSSWEILEGSIIGNSNVLERTFNQTSSGSGFFKVEEMTTPDFGNRTLYRENFQSLPPGINFRGAEITYSYFTNASVKGSNFDDALLNSCFLERADFSAASFKRAQMFFILASGAEFNAADFEGSSLYSMDFTGANFSRTKFQNATLVLCDFTSAIGLDLSDSRVIACTMPDGSFRNDP